MNRTALDPRQWHILLRRWHVARATEPQTHSAVERSYLQWWWLDLASSLEPGLLHSGGKAGRHSWLFLTCLPAEGKHATPVKMHVGLRKKKKASSAVVSGTHACAPTTHWTDVCRKVTDLHRAWVFWTQIFLTDSATPPRRKGIQAPKKVNYATGNWRSKNVYDKEHRCVKACRPCHLLQRKAR